SCMPMRETDDSGQWFREQFEHADLGDGRRRRRAVSMAQAVARRPSGKISEVFRSDAQREGAYDFVESNHIDAAALMAGIGVATAKRCAKGAFAFVPMDGTGVAVVDRTRKKGFGTIAGRQGHDAAGVKVISAYAVDPCGVPLGLAAQRYW